MHKPSLLQSFKPSLLKSIGDGKVFHSFDTLNENSNKKIKFGSVISKISNTIKTGIQGIEH
jgi:hypothetical protein